MWLNYGLRFNFLLKKNNSQKNWPHVMSFQKIAYSFMLLQAHCFQDISGGRRQWFRRFACLAHV